MRELTSAVMRMRLRRITGGSVLAMLLLAGTARAAEPDPMYGRIRAGLRREAVASRLVPTRLPTAAVAVRVARPQSRPAKPRHSLWRGAAIGAGIGALIGGAVWGPSLCTNDSECLAITVPAGLGVGAGIGAAVGAIVQAVAR